MTKSARFANWIFGVAAAVLLLLLLYFGYKHLQGTAASPLTYGVLLGALLAILAAMRFLPPNVKVNLALLGLTTLLLVYALEAFLHVYGHPLDYRTPNFVAARTQRVPFDRRTPLQVVDQMRNDGIDAYPYVSPNLFIGQMPETEAKERIYVFGGISNVTTVHCNETGTYMVYESDRYGFHNPNAIWDEPSMDVVALGDSFTQGACVQSAENYVSLMRDAVPQTLNLGASGNGPLSALGTLKEYGAQYEPRHVFWFYYEGNDMGDFLAEVSNLTLPRYVEDDFSQNLINRQDDVNFVRGQYVEAVMAGIDGVRWRERLDALRLYNVRRLLRLTRAPASLGNNRAADRLGPQGGAGQAPTTNAPTDNVADAGSGTAAAGDADAQGIAASLQNQVANTTTMDSLSSSQHQEKLTEQSHRDLQDQTVQFDPTVCTWEFADMPDQVALETNVLQEYDSAVYDPALAVGVENLVQVADYTQDLVESWGGELTVVFLPDYMRFYPLAPAGPDVNYRPCVLEAFDLAGVDVLDLLPVFEAHPDPLTLYPFGLYGHYSVAGNALVAKEVLDYLRK